MISSVAAARGILTSAWTGVFALSLLIAIAVAQEEPLFSPEQKRIQREQALKDLEARAKTGDSDARYFYALTCIYTLNDPITGVRYLEAAAAEKHPDAMAELGVCCELGIGTPKDGVRAVALWREALPLGSARAYQRLGIYYFTGAGGLQKDAVRGREYLLKAIELGREEDRELLNAYESR